MTVDEVKNQLAALNSEMTIEEMQEQMLALHRRAEMWRQRAEAAGARVKELEADLRSVPIMELMRAYPAVRWYVFNDEIRIRKWVEHIEELYAEWVKEQTQPATEPARE